MWEWGLERVVNGKQTRTRVYFCHLTLERQLTDYNVWMFVYWKECVSKGMALRLSVFAGSFMIMLFSSSLSLFLFPFLCVCLCVCVRTLPEGKIRHELGKQALQSWSVLQTRQTEG